MTAAALAPCERHEMTGCADCTGPRRPVTGRLISEVRREEARNAPGTCGAETYAEITGETLAEAARALAAYGYTPQGGITEDGLAAAFRAVGFTVSDVTHLSAESLPAASAAGTRAFYVAGWQRGRGHAWSVTEGTARRAFTGRFTYRAYEVMA